MSARKWVAHRPAALMREPAADQISRQVHPVGATNMARFPDAKPTDTTLSVGPKHHSGLFNTTGITHEKRHQLV